MGNQQMTNSNNRPSSHKFLLERRQRDIILDYDNKKKVKISDILYFPSGLDGLHLWDSNIILSRYILEKKDMFKGKKVVELMSGTGIASIVLKLQTQALIIAAVQSFPETAENIKYNCQKNNIKSGVTIANIKLSEHEKFKSKFDFIVAADIITRSCKIDQLRRLITQILDVAGIFILVAPIKSIQFIQKFADSLHPSQFSVSKNNLSSHQYFDSPLLNKVLGFEEYPSIEKGQFVVFLFQKIKQPTLNAENQKDQEQKGQIEKKKDEEGQNEKKKDEEGQNEKKKDEEGTQNDKNEE